MKRSLVFQFFLLVATFHSALGINAPSALVSRTGDKSIVLHWDANTEVNLAGYRVYRSSTNAGPFTLLTPSLLTTPGYCDLTAANGQTNFYQVTAVTTASQESTPSTTLAASAHLFVSDDQFLDYVQQTSFDYFWYAGNPSNGLVPDRSSSGSACSIAAVGFGLTSIGIGIDHSWITRTQGAARTLTTLNTFLLGPQGSGSSGIIGYNGWFYHFLDMNTGLRAGSSELSSIDTALLLGGVLYSKQYFDGTNATETSIRSAADTIFNRIDWNWMARGTNAVAMGWQPSTGFNGFGDWIGYNEGMIIYLLGLGAATNPLPSSAWSRWTSGYTWAINYGQAFIPFPPLFGHQYSHCWIDFRHIADGYMNSHSSTYFENSRRATLAQRSYCMANPAGRTGYSANIWGLSACDSPGGYAVHGTPPPQNDDGTIAPTAAGGSMAFTPEYSLPNLRNLYNQGRLSMWTSYGFRDGFNLGQQFYATDVLGIDQGPIVIMIENYRTQKIWKQFMKNPEIQRGLERAGFVSLPFIPVQVENLLTQSEIGLSWLAPTGGTFQIEYSPDLTTWLASPTGEEQATNNQTVEWLDTGPPATVSSPASVPQRFYRVFQMGPP
jgi:hypothetical protein